MRYLGDQVPIMFSIVSTMLLILLVVPISHRLSTLLVICSRSTHPSDGGTLTNRHTHTHTSRDGTDFIPSTADAGGNDYN